MRGSQFYSAASIPELYRWFAGEAASSPIWQEMCTWIAEDEAAAPIRERLHELPGIKRQPNLFLAALRWFDLPTSPGPDFRAVVLERWSSIRDVIVSRATQTNEPGRCATIAPLLGQLGERVALIEIGMSAGLCLIPDRYGYRWQTPTGTVTANPDSPLQLDCEVTGNGADGSAPAVPEVVWRGGIDLNPLAATDPDDARWLRSLVWPGQLQREERLRGALELAADEDIHVFTGDCVDLLPQAVAAAPKDVPVVVFGSAVLGYLPRERRDDFAEVVRSLPVHWISNEGERVVPGLRDRVPPFDGPPNFVLGLDAEPVARVGSHGQWLHWL